MDVQSGESEEEEVKGDGIGESEMEELVPEWGWSRDKGSWLELWNGWSSQVLSTWVDGPCGELITVIGHSYTISSLSGTVSEI